jgi:cob(I)alamin adenosyltransferase
MAQQNGRVERPGLVHVYTGDGKGKTTAALGIAVRAAGHGMRTYVGQFLKGRACGELKSLQRLAPDVTVEQLGTDRWIGGGGASLTQRQAAQLGLPRARGVLLSGEYDIVILDEVNVAVHFGILAEEEVLQLIECRPPETELVLTGRQAPEVFIARADLVTEMRQVRHPYERGIKARPGIEY